MKEQKDRDEPKLASGDKALLHAAATGEGAVIVTPDMLNDMKAVFAERKKDIDERFPQLVADCPYETRLAIAAWVFRHVVDHAKDGGTFRYLIYDRLGFDSDAYMPLYLAGGMTISNEFDLSKPEPVHD
jgi:hypothetical protein